MKNIYVLNNNFNEFIRKERINSLLIGNGFGLSHPYDGLNGAFEFSHEVIIKDMGGILNDTPKSAQYCPEKFLEYLRKSVAKRIILSYIEKLSEKELNESLFKLYKWHKYQCTSFLQCFNNIYTLNYDPIMYFEFLKLYDSEEKRKTRMMHSDGFFGEKFITQDTVSKRLNNSENKIMYLHGSYFIHINYQNSKIKKLNRSNITEQYLKNSLEKGSEKPFLVLEGSWEFKENLIKKNNYLNYCYEHLLNQTDKLLIFGVSFNNDDHILKALRDNKKLTSIYITYENGKKENLEERIGRICKDDDRFKYISINEKYSIWCPEDIDEYYESQIDGYF